MCVGANILRLEYRICIQSLHIFVSTLRKPQDLTVDIKHAFVDLPLKLNWRVSMLILNISSLFLKFEVDMWKKFRRREQRFSNECDKTCYFLEKNVPTIISVMRPRCYNGRSLEQTSLWADVRACDIEDTGTRDVTK
jgi:hypothetical protein